MGSVKDKADVKHETGITREIYAISHEYAEAMARLRQISMTEDAISCDAYAASMEEMATALLTPEIRAQMPASDIYDALIIMAAVSARWARHIRISQAP